jgi:hypothetical protein
MKFERGFFDETVSKGSHRTVLEVDGVEKLCEKSNIAT